MEFTPAPVIDAAIIEQIEGERPPFPPALLSRAEKGRLIQRGFHGLYRWYTDRSQRTRNWNPDRSFDWRAFGQRHSPELLAIVEGFYAVEQYAPDYTAELTRLTRRNYGRAQFALRWGSEEEKHADLWRNALLASRQRTPGQIERYTDDLRAAAWTAPYEDPLRMLLYTVFQERATQLSYMNLAKVARGESTKPQFAGDADPVLAAVCRAIAVDEAAHYEFFLEGARLFLYYYPGETLAGLAEVLRGFTMPASRIVPDYEAFIRALYEGGVFGQGMYAREVVPAAMKSLGVDSLRAVERGIGRSRRVPDEGGRMRETALFDAEARAAPSHTAPGRGVDFRVVEAAVMRLFDRITRYEEEVGLSGF
jgi:acyl-[acyl-carrier-protein] desaturase